MSQFQPLRFMCHLILNQSLHLHCSEWQSVASIRRAWDAVMCGSLCVIIVFMLWGMIVRHKASGSIVIPNLEAVCVLQVQSGWTQRIQQWSQRRSCSERRRPSKQQPRSWSSSNPEPSPRWVTTRRRYSWKSGRAVKEYAATAPNAFLTPERNFNCTTVQTIHFHYNGWY